MKNLKIKEIKDTILGFPKSIVDFLRLTWGELKKTKWLSIEETVRLTGVVLLIIVLMGFFFTIIDRVFVRGVSNFLDYLIT